jgi:serine/threonine protein phosphatase PrpC
MMDQNIVRVLQVVSRTDIGKKRPVNQDALRAHPFDPNHATQHGLFLVADGVGGNLPKGEIASRTAVDAMADYYYSLAANTDMLRRVEQALQAAHTHVREQALAEGVGTIGTTIVGLALAPDGEAVAFNVGDSHIYLVRHGEIRLISEDQVSPGVAGHLPSRRSTKISSYLGQPNPLEPNYYPIEARIGDTYILCTDGIWSKVSDDELRDVILGQSIEQAADTLVQMVLDRGAPDNLTVVIVQLGKPVMKADGRRKRRWILLPLILILSVVGFYLIRQETPGALFVNTGVAVEPTRTSEAGAEPGIMTETAAALIVEPTETPVLTPTSLPPTPTQMPTLTISPTVVPSPTHTATATRTPPPTATDTASPTPTEAPPTSTINPTFVTFTPSPPPAAPNIVQRIQTAAARLISSDTKPSILVSNPRGVNVRTGPGTNYPLVGRGIALNEKAAIEGYAQDSIGQKWYYVIPENSRPGWVVAEVDGVEVQGDLSRVPARAIPPTPVPTETAAPTETQTPAISDP